MRRVAALILAIVVSVCVHQLRAAEFSMGVLAGYTGGLGFRASGMVSNFAQGFPLAFSVGVAHTRLDPGMPLVARKVFINDATNGTPEEGGWIWDFRLDFLYKMRVLGLQNAYAFLGVRKALFTGNFRFIGGNEDFDVTSSPWGWGGGLKADFPMGRMLSFSVTAGFDHYPATTLTGHDTSYGPNGEHVNGRQGYDYTAADDAVNQPKFVPVLMAGFSLAL